MENLTKEQKAALQTLLLNVGLELMDDKKAMLIEKMVEQQILTEEEEGFYRRGRNSKSQTSAKNTDIKTYRMSTGFESVIGYLHLTDQEERVASLVKWCIQQVEEKKEGTGDDE